jgi:hypothetical protein
MRAARFDAAKVSAFLDKLCEELEGEWLLVGGAAACLWFAPERVTEDIDLVGLAGRMEDRLALMRLAGAEGLPIEAVNSAADFFVYRIPDWRSQIEVLRRGPRAVVYRPTATLFLLLKLRRLSEQDLEDCEALLRWILASTPGADLERVAAALDSLPATEDEALASRRDELREALRAASI